MSNNAGIHRNTGLGIFLNPSTHFPGSSRKLIDQQERKYLEARGSILGGPSNKRDSFGHARAAKNCKQQVVWLRRIKRNVG
jgi:hypothetical protein